MQFAMQFSEQWKSFFPIGIGGIGNPLVYSNPSAVGPLFFNPDPKTLTHIFSSTSLLPNLHLPPCLSPFRFLLSSDPSSILPSIASSVTSHHDLSQNDHNDTASYFLFNRIQLLNYPNRPSVLIFFPTGANDDKVGFFMLSIKDSKLHLQPDHHNADVFRASIGSSTTHRILRILVNPAAHSDRRVIGYLLVSTLHSVHWFLVLHDSILDRPIVSYIGGKDFTCPVVHVCWSPHVLEESLILLENGDLFLFVLKLKSYCFIKGTRLRIKGTRLRVPWSDDSENKVVWLSCEFSWDHRVLIVARSDAIFLVDLRLKKCNVSFRLKIETLRKYAPDENEQFLALSRAGPDNNYFAVASTSLLLLCDVRKEMPVLQWVHGIDRPYHISLLSLSSLRSHSREDTFKLASDSGFCIILGSFWNCDFNLFCYGSTLPFRKGSVAFELSKIEATVYAWELPSEINLSSHHEFPCGSCLLREDSLKGVLPEWIDWQLKREMVFGFCILCNDLASLLCGPDEHGGFTMIRLMSSGKLELQRYHSSWALARNLNDCHGQELCLDRDVLYPMSDEKHKFPKKFHFDDLKLHYLYKYAGGNLTQFLRENLKTPKNTSVDAQKKEPPFAAEVHEFLCEKLNACQFGRLRSCPASSGVFKDVNLPASFHEVTLRRLWADLPLELLQLAFLKYSACPEVVGALEFLALPDLPQLPPFCLRKTSPHSNDDIVGPVIPLSVLIVLNEFRNGRSDLEEGKFSVEAELGLKYNEVVQVAGEISVSAYGSTQLDNNAVSLADDGAETWVGSSKPKSFLSYRPVAFNCSATDLVRENFLYSDRIYDTFIFHVPEKKKSSDQTESVGQEIFDDLCPVELRFDAPVKKFEPQGLKAYNLLKRQMSKWQGGFDSYKEFCIQSRFEN